MARVVSAASAASLVLALPSLAQEARSADAPRSLPTYTSDASPASTAKELVFDRIDHTVTAGQIANSVSFEIRRLPATFKAPYPDKRDEFCTATLVGPRVILTAAHCIDMKLPNGAFQLRSIGVRTTKDGQVVASTSCAVSAAYLSKSYNHPSPRNSHDYALCELSEEIPVRAEVINLDTKAAAVGKKLMLAGYGCTYDAQLREVRQNLLLVGVNVRSGMDSGWLTLGGKIGTNAALLCSGDSGGAVYADADPAQPSGDGAWTIAAVASGVKKGDDGATVTSYISPLAEQEFRDFLDDWQYSKSPRRLIRARSLCGRDIVKAPKTCRTATP